MKEWWILRSRFIVVLGAGFVASAALLGVIMQTRPDNEVATKPTASPVVLPTPTPEVGSVAGAETHATPLPTPTKPPIISNHVMRKPAKTP